MRQEDGLNDVRADNVLWRGCNDRDWNTCNNSVRAAFFQTTEKNGGEDQRGVHIVGKDNIMAFQIIYGDITNMDTEAVVNAANKKLKNGGGVCGAIFAAAGEKELENECKSIGGCPTGQAVITKGYRLTASYIIHAVGPRWYGGFAGEKKKLASCYTAALELAKQYGIKSIAFPLISSGIYHYPKRQALEIAQEAIGKFLETNDMQVYLVLLEK